MQTKPVSGRTPLRHHAGLLKLGLEFFLANGADGFKAIAGAPIFLDLKLHDIPNTVAGGVRAVLPLRPRMLTIHASGGSAMIRAAHQAAGVAATDRPMILAVTVLTSLDQTDLIAVGVAGDAGGTGYEAGPARHRGRRRRAGLQSAGGRHAPSGTGSGCQAGRARHPPRRSQLPATKPVP